MKIPEFTAEYSLGKCNKSYRTQRHTNNGTEMIAMNNLLPQMRMAGPWRLPVGNGTFCVIGVEDDETKTSHYEIVKCADIHYP